MASATLSQPAQKSVSERLRELEVEKTKILCDATNAHTLHKMFLSTWLPNFRANGVQFNWFNPETKKLTIDDLPKEPKPKPAIVIGGGDISDDEIKALKDFKGTIICTNKYLKRVIKLGIIPHWAVVIHTTPEILEDFRHSVEKLTDNVKEIKRLLEEITKSDFKATDKSLEEIKKSYLEELSKFHLEDFIADEEITKHYKNIRAIAVNTIDPKLAKFLADNFKEVYWATAVIDPTYLPNGSRMLSDLASMPECVTMGNVGCFGLLAIRSINHPLIGLLGFNMGHHPLKTWSMKEASECEYHYHPQLDYTICQDAPFSIYFIQLMNWIQGIQKEGVTIINCTHYSMFRFRDDIVPYMHITEFIKKANEMFIV